MKKKQIYLLGVVNMIEEINRDLENNTKNLCIYNKEIGIDQCCE